jgi:hypothetical protein
MYKQHNRSIGKRESLSLQEVISLIAQKNGCKAQQSGRGYITRCTAHEDKKASLSVAVGNDGTILMRCHAGCSIDDICTSINIMVRNLFAQNSKGYRYGK